MWQTDSWSWQIVELPAPVAFGCHSPFFAQSIESVTVRKYFSNCFLDLKNRHVFGLDMEKLGFVVSKWYHDVTMPARRFSAP